MARQFTVQLHFLQRTTQASGKAATGPAITTDIVGEQKEKVI